MEKLNAIVIDGKVYEAVDRTRNAEGLYICDDCSLNELCHDESRRSWDNPCGDFGEDFRLMNWRGTKMFRYSQALTDKINLK